MFQKWFFKGTNAYITIWMVISVLVLVCNSIFWINDYIDHPQHGLFDDFEKVSKIIEEEGKLVWYRTYFILDFFWAACLLIIIGSLSKDSKGNSLGNYKVSRTTASYLFIGIASAALVFDILEGIFYWTFDDSFLKNIVDIKLVCYLICFGFFLYFFFKSYVIPNIRFILRFLGISIWSILFILLIYALITLLPQGGTIIVNLFYYPINIIIFFFMITFLAEMLAHYPAYVDIWKNADNSCVTLKMDPKSSFLGFGIIYYDTLYTRSKKNRAYRNVIVKGLRRSLGILLYVAVFNIFFGVISRFYQVELNALMLTFFIGTITLFVYYLEGARYKNWGRILDSKNPNAEKQEKVVQEITRHVRRFPWYGIFCTLIAFAVALVAHCSGWSRISVIVFLISLGCQMFLHIQFKILRTYFKYVFFSDGLYNLNKKMFNPETLEIFKKYNPIFRRQSNSNRFYLFFGKLSDNISYLKLMRVSGIISLTMLVLANFNFSIASYLNPLNIILLYIILYYSLAVLTFKHILYYHRLEGVPNGYSSFFKYGIPLVLIMLPVILYHTSRMENNLHELTLVKSQQPLGHEEYLKSMTNGRNDGHKNNYFFIGSYGGGLKANLWNLLLLEKLEQESNKEFLGRTLVISGVSGGAVGIGNFASLIHEQTDSVDIMKRIKEIGNSNVLSNELTYLLGKDWVREYVPSNKYKGRDRSYKSMELHAQNTGMKQYNEIGFTDYWRKIYEGRSKKFPALVMNTTSVGGKQGVASSVKFPENTFPGADIITHFDDKDSTLTYYGAISTTNRFPLFSPTAKIPSKGSYLDGGYFENSGLLSAMEVFDALSGDPSKEFYNKINPIFINIINSEEFYIAQKIKEFCIRAKNNQNPSELGAILGTVTSIDKLPMYVFEKIQSRDFVVEPIMMPHKLSYGKIKEILNGDFDYTPELMKKIKAHNETIDSALKSHKDYEFKKWGVVQPPLARILSEPAVEYQIAMVNYHPSIKSGLARIIEYMTTDSVVTSKYQKKLIKSCVNK